MRSRGEIPASLLGGRKQGLTRWRDEYPFVASLLGCRLDRALFLSRI